MSTNLKSLVLFVTVADHGSISEGAKRCHIALAAASKRISDLEARAQRPLLVRHARGVTLTSAGHGLLRHAKLLGDEHLDQALYLAPSADASVSFDKRLTTLWRSSGNGATNSKC